MFLRIDRKVSASFFNDFGDGPLREELQKQVEDLGISDKVYLAGEVSDVRSYLLKADIFASSSLYEGLPLSMLEAMAAGLPIVANNVGGIPDIIKDGYNGYLIPLGEKEKYIEALDEIISNEEHRKVLADNARALSAEYDESKTVEGYEQLYQTEKN